MNELSLVTGANGHLGNNLIRVLVEKGENVRASVRDIDNAIPFEGIDCERIYADILDLDSLKNAMKGVHTLYHCAAIFKHWAPSPQKEIVQPNIDGARNVLDAANEEGVKKIVFVSGMVALNFNSPPMDETGWNTNFQYSDPYAEGKTKAEKLALKLAKENNQWLTTVIPSAMVGPHLYGHETTIMSFLKNVLENGHKIDLGFNTNVVSITDVSEGMYLVAKNGISGQRYIMGNENPISTTRIFELAKEIFPETEIPSAVPKEKLLNFAKKIEKESMEKKTPPSLTCGLVNRWYHADTRLTITKARSIGFNPTDSETVLRKILTALK